MQSLDATSGLPRFNMAFELGLVIGCINSDAEHASENKKEFLVFDSEPHRLDASCSDLKGYEVVSHFGDPKEIIISASEWLASAGKRHLYLPEHLIPEFEEFEERLPDICGFLLRPVSRIAYRDLCYLMDGFFDEKDERLSRGA